MKTTLLITILFYFWVEAPWVQAQNIGVTLPDTTMMAEDTIQLPLYVDSTLTNRNISAFDLEIDYMSTHFTYIGVSEGELIANKMTLSVNSSSDNKLYISGASSDVLVGKGVLLYLHLIAKEPYYKSPIEVNASSVFNESIHLSANQSNVKIVQRPTIYIMPDYAELMVGESLQMSVRGDTSSPFTYQVVDPSIGYINSDGLFTATSDGASQIQVTDAQQASDITDYTVNVYSMSLSTSLDTKQWQGSLVDIPIYLHNKSTEEILSGQFVLSFNNRYLTFEDIMTSNTLTENVATEYMSSSSSSIKVNFAASQALANDTLLMYARFRVSDTYTGYSTLDISDAQINENSHILELDGRFTTINYQSIYLSTRTIDLLVGDTLALVYYGGTPPLTYHSSDENIATISSDGVVYALGGGEVSFTATDSVGSKKESDIFQVFDTYIEIADIAAPINMECLIPISIGNMTAPLGMSAFELELEYNAQQLEWIDIVKSDCICENWLIDYALDQGKLSVSAAGTNEVNEGGILFYLKYHLKPNFTLNQRSNIYLSSVTLNEGTPTALQRNGSVTCIKSEDLYLDQILSPTSDCQLGTQENVTIAIGNNGFVDYAKGDTLLVAYSMGYSSEVLDTIVLSKTFAQQSTLQFTFNKTVDMSDDNQQYTLQARTLLSSVRDANTSNDEIAKTIYNYNDESLYLGEDIVVVGDTTVSVTAPLGYESYQWSPALSDTNVIRVDQSTLITLTVTNSMGCTATDTINVDISPWYEKPVIHAPITEACVGDTIYLYAPDNYSQYKWSNGDTTHTIEVTQSGSYSVVVYTNATSTIDTLSAIAIQFNEIPQADFSYETNGLQVNFNNETQYASSYLWTFGDGHTSTEQNPTHVYAWTSPNSATEETNANPMWAYHVTLTSYHQGCYDTKHDTISNTELVKDTIVDQFFIGEHYMLYADTFTNAGTYYVYYQEDEDHAFVTYLMLTAVARPIMYDTLVLCMNELPFDYRGYIIEEGTEAGTLHFDINITTEIKQSVSLNLSFYHDTPTSVINYGDVCAGTVINDKPRFDEHYDTIAYQNACGLDSTIIYRWDIIDIPILNIIGDESVKVDETHLYQLQTVLEGIEWSSTSDKVTITYPSDTTISITFGSVDLIELVATISHKCGIYSDTLLIDVAAIQAGMEQGNSKQTVSIYPIPATDILNIDSEVDITHIELYDIMGQVVKQKIVSGRKSTIPLQDIVDKGVYFIQVTTVHNQKIKKRIIIN